MHQKNAENHTGNPNPFHLFWTMTMINLLKLLDAILEEIFIRFLLDTLVSLFFILVFELSGFGKVIGELVIKPIVLREDNDDRD